MSDTEATFSTAELTHHLRNWSGLDKTKLWYKVAHAAADALDAKDARIDQLAWENEEQQREIERLKQELCDAGVECYHDYEGKPQ